MLTFKQIEALYWTVRLGTFSASAQKLHTTQSAITSLFKSVPNDPLKDFAPVGRLVDLPSLLVVNNKLPVKTVQDFIAYAKSHPHTLQYGYGNVSRQIAGEIIERPVRHSTIRLVNLD